MQLDDCRITCVPLKKCENFQNSSAARYIAHCIAKVVTKNDFFFLKKKMKQTQQQLGRKPGIILMACLVSRKLRSFLIPELKE